MHLGGCVVRGLAMIGFGHFPPFNARHPSETRDLI
ncbi:hypothetical protein V475_10945 [Sphingobium baderi LL03]|uniref:Uncharacterized protein n=1 Tax=Sphingobium baderi LL03 TaxID=1114964 RepID=T0GJV5_9SPHN|nr:hypothetical protein L485_13695 [Sphingobium baderi LL03]KMS61943.1 hypothetical protein V475_10945 [Sphingobium baderi LL03]